MRKNKKTNTPTKLEFSCFFKIALNTNRFHSYFKSYILKLQ